MDRISKCVARIIRALTANMQGKGKVRAQGLELPEPWSPVHHIVLGVHLEPGGFAGFAGYPTGVLRFEAGAGRRWNVTAGCGARPTR